MFRLTINDQRRNKDDEVLGDRTLSAWVGTEPEGLISLATYSYLNLNGEGNANVHQNVPHKNHINGWHHVYFAYSRNERRAIAFVQFPSGKAEISFKNINHYLTNKFYFAIAKDQFYKSYIGRISDVELSLCHGAFDPKFKPEPRIRTPEVPVPKKDEICLSKTNYVEVNKQNIDDVIRMLMQAKKELDGGVEAEEDECFCRVKGKKSNPKFIEVG